jgi:5-methyltetrahydrofolate--homocysteine methyltransferase
LVNIKELKEKLILGAQNDVADIVQEMLEGESSPQEILNDALIAGMDVVGEKFERGEYFIPQVLLAARAMKAGMNILKPHLASSDTKAQGIVVVGTVKGDIHDIGKNLVAIMLEGSGFEIHDLGVDVSSENFIRKASEINADIIAMSSLITTSMTYMGKVVDDVKNSSLDGVNTIIGGAPVTKQFADEIGASGYGDNAAEAVRLVKTLIG